MSRDDPKSRTRTSRTTNDTRPDVVKGSESEKPLLPLSKLPLPPQSSFRSNLRKPAARFSDVNSGSSRSEQTGPTDSHVTDDSVRPPARRSALTDPLLGCRAAVLIVCHADLNRFYIPLVPATIDQAQQHRGRSNVRPRVWAILCL